MKVILRENVKLVGSIGEIVDVSPGHARNLLIPTGKAIIANEKNMAAIEDQQRRLEKKVREQKEKAKDLRKDVEKVSLTIFKRVGGNGRLFGTVTPTDVVKALAKESIDIEKRMVTFESPIKQLGEFISHVQLFPDVVANVKIQVEMDPTQIEENEKKLRDKKLREQAQKERLAREKAANASAEESSENSEDSDLSSEVKAETEESNAGSESPVQS